MAADFSQFRDTFFEESSEHLATMESSLLALESAGDGTELLKAIFRAAHTIKGGSGMFGLDALGHFTHVMESLLDRMRNSEIQPSPPLIDLLLRCCDLVKDLLAAARNNAPPPEGIEAVIAELEQAMGSAPAAAKPPKPGSQDRVSRVWKVRFTPEAGSVKKGLEPLLVLRELSEMGTVSDLDVDTSSIPSLEELDPGTCHLGWRFRLTTSAAAADLEDVFAFVENGSEYSLEQEASESQAPAAAGSSRAAAIAKSASGPAPGHSAPGHPNAGHPTSGHPAAAPRAGAAAGETTIRVDVDLLDRLMNIVGELVLARNQILQYSSSSRDSTLVGAAQRLNLITSELQEGVMKTRMQPIGIVWGVMPRLVRDLAANCGKRIRLDMEGAETELDRTLLEAIKDPLTHIVRNACDHGIETPEAREAAGKPAEGRLQLRAYHEGGHVIVEMTDDGSGIDPARVRAKAVERGILSADAAARMSDRDAAQIVFLPGFSTAEQVTGVSGRGVGMDVVKTNIERIGGAIDLSSQVGAGTVVRLKIPLTLAIIPGLVVTAASERFVIPQMNLLELLRLEGEDGRKQIEYVHQTPVYRRRGQLLPIVDLSATLALGSSGQQDVVNIVVVQAEECAFGLIVDEIRDTQEIVVKPLAKQLKGLGCYSGSTIMGDGHVSLILDVIGIAQRSALMGEHSRACQTSATSQGEARNVTRQTLLLFRSGGFERLAVPLSLVARLEEFPQQRLERSGRGFVVQYRESILPLLSLREVLGEPGDSELAADPLPVVVFAHGHSGVGLVVEEILDVIEEEGSERHRCERPGLVGSAIVDGRVTDFLDVHMLLRAAQAGRPHTIRSQRPKRVLVADRSAFDRALVRNDLEMAGYRVIEAGSAPEAVEKRQDGIEVLAVEGDLLDASAGVSEPRSLRQLASDRGIAVLKLAPPQEGGTSSGGLVKFDRTSMLESLERLSAAMEEPAGVRV